MELSDLSPELLQYALSIVNPTQAKTIAEKAKTSKDFRALLVEAVAASSDPSTKEDSGVLETDDVVSAATGKGDAGGKSESDEERREKQKKIQEELKKKQKEQMKAQYTVLERVTNPEGKTNTKQSKEKNMRKFAINSARGEVNDSTRQLVRDILDQVPALVKVPAKQQGIAKEVFGPDHVCYYYTEEGPRKGSYVTVEIHTDPSDLYSDIYITTRASFAAAAEGGEARQDEREITLDEFVIEDLEDYSLADVDRIDEAVSKGFDAAQKFDEKNASTIESRKALFASKHSEFIASGKRAQRAINSDASWQKYVQQIMDEEGLTREEAEEEAARRQAYC